MIENKNNFGFLRLFFAFLVIFAHSPDLIDGNQLRVPLYGLLKNVGLGGLAVDGFFLISGYLILKSFQNSSSIKSYLIKRCLRIYPAFIVATLFCIFLIAPLSGGTEILFRIEAFEWFKSFARLVRLAVPFIDGAFLNNHHPVLNGSMWTIRYEFICYLSILLWSYLRFLRKPHFLFLVIALLILYAFVHTFLHTIRPDLQRVDAVNIFDLSRFFLVFSIGSFFYLYQDKIKWNLAFTVIGLLGLLLCLQHKFFAELGVIIFGGYLLFNFALNYKNNFLASIGAKTDISYGVYLYAWPVQSLFVQYYPKIEPYQLNIATLIVVVPLAYLSFKFVEKPCMDLKNKWR